MTLVGPGGVGKTRLALAAARDVEHHFADGAVWVALGHVTDPALVVPTIAQAVGGDGEPAAELAELDVLLVLDDVEHVAAAAPEVGELLRGAPRTRLLATSRQPLRLSGERQYPVAPLPDADGRALFELRAAAVDPEFEADDAVVEICRRLDGLPLAIELAAARVNVLSPREIAGRLDRRLPLLATGPADAPTRQRTLRGTIAWSYDLLDEREQAAFARLAPFASWSLDAAERVAETDFEILASLVEKSLVQQQGGRFSMLETVREYADERLAERGESDELTRRHAQYFAELAQEADRRLFTKAGREWTERLRAEHENVRLALAWTLRAGELELGLRLAAGLMLFWFQRDYLDEGERWLSTLLDAPGEVEDGVRARALSVLATLVGVRGEPGRAIALGDESIALARKAGDAETLGRALVNRAHGFAAAGDEAAVLEAIEEALPLLRTSGEDSHAVRRALHLLAGHAQRSGDFERARELHTDVVARWREAGTEFGLGIALHSLGDFELDANRLPAARAAYDEALRVARDEGAVRVMCYCLGGLAAIAATEGDTGRASALWTAVRVLEERLGFRLRPDRAERYAEAVGSVTPDEAPMQAPESLLEDAVSYALGETSEPTWSRGP